MEVVVFLLDGVLFFVLVVVVVVVGRLKLDWRDPGYFEIGAALRAAYEIALVDVELIDLDFGITFRAGGHTSSSTDRSRTRDGQHSTVLREIVARLRIIART